MSAPAPMPGLARWSLPLLLLCVAVAGVAAWRATQTPAPRPADIPVAEFSAARALVDLRWIAAEPHPTGSAAAARVRDRLVAQLAQAGLEVEVQRTHAFAEYRNPRLRNLRGGNVENVVAVLPGRDRSLPAVMMMAHYDSVANSPGAADDGLGVAVMLEVSRAIARDARQRDVVFLFTDAEEAGLLGARAFFAEHPLAQRIGTVVNLEARGSRGRALLFETGPGNAGLIRTFAAGAPLPAGNSLTGFVYRYMPNGTDFTVPAERGIPGLNFAILGGLFDYHAASSTVDNLDPGSVQHMGAQVLPLVRTLAVSPTLPAADVDLVYSDLPGGWMIALPAWSGWVVWLLALLPMGVVARRASWADGGWRGALSGLALVPLTLLSVALAVRLAYRLLGGGDASLLLNRDLLAVFPTLATGLGLLSIGTVLAVGGLVAGSLGRRTFALVALVVGVAASLRGGFDPVALVLGVVVAGLGWTVAGTLRRGETVRLGTLAFFGLLGAVVQALAPELAPLLLWPLLGVGVVAWCLPANAPLQAVRVAVAGLATVYGLAHVFGLALQVFDAVGFGTPEVLAVPAVWLTALALPWLRVDHGRRAPAIAPLAVVLLASGVLVAAAFPRLDRQRYPALSQVMFVADPGQGEYHRVSALPPSSAWSRAALHADRESPVPRPLLAVDLASVWATPAAPIAVAEPIRFEQSRDAATGETVLRVQAPAATRDLRVLLKSAAAVPGVTLQGEPAPLLDTPDTWSRLRWHAPGAQGIELRWPGDAGPVEIQAAAGIDGWPHDAEPLPPRAPDVMPWSTSDMTWVLGQTRVEP
ncbi:M20/M25/M40 family metallo-hydrolase [Luteimonas sp. TWI662]|uniref:M20/M25/M40 family metallo-hydrolase n=1 Tax=Luteimonas sp. TWI662 TaxID=3136789 RepID=UPI00320B8FD7